MTKALRKTCRYCSTKIPYGKNYCYTHYQAELVDYRQKLKQYEADLRAYEQLTSEERESLRGNADDVSLATHAFVSGLLIGLLVWYSFMSSTLSDGLFALIIGLGAGVIFVVVPPLRILLGKLSRSMLHGAVYYGVFFVVVFALSYVSNIVDNNRSNIYIALVPICLLISIAMEFSGNHKPSLEPNKPTPPNP